MANANLYLYWRPELHFACRSISRWVFILTWQPALIKWACSSDTAKLLQLQPLKNNVRGDPSSPQALISFIPHWRWETCERWLLQPPAGWAEWRPRERKGTANEKAGARQHLMKEGAKRLRVGGARGQAAPSGAFVLLAEGLSSSGSKWWRHRVKHGRGGRGHCCLLSPWQQVLSCSCASFTSGNKPLFYSLSSRSFTSSFSTFFKNNNLLVLFDSFLQSKPISFPHHFMSTPSKHPFISSPLFFFPALLFFHHPTLSQSISGWVVCPLKRSGGITPLIPLWENKSRGRPVCEISYRRERVGRNQRGGTHRGVFVLVPC